MVPYLFEMECVEDEKETKDRIIDLLCISDEEKKKIKFEIIGKSKLGRLLKKTPHIVRAYYTEEKIPDKLLLRSIIYNILSKMELEAEIVDIQQKDNMLQVNIDSEQSAFIIGKRGKMLDTIQYIVNLLAYLNTKNGDRVLLNISGYRERRQIALKNLSNKIHDQVTQSGRARLTNFMNPYERRIVHLHFEKNPDMSTESLGTGLYKRVRIYQTNQNSQEDRSHMKSRSRNNKSKSRGNQIVKEKGPQEDTGNTWQDEVIDEVDGNIATKY